MTQLVPASELVALLRARYPYAVHNIFDASFNIPTEASFGAFRDELRDHFRRTVGDKWEEFFDCDNFAFAALAFAGLKHLTARKAGHGSAQGVAFGVVCFHTTPGDRSTAHAVNVRLRPDKTFIEFEPQTRLDLVLTKPQCDSAWFTLWS